MTTDVALPARPEAARIRQPGRQSHAPAARPAPARQQPLSPEDLSPVESEIIVVASPKGGTGKTTVAANLAAGLARSGAGSVALIDADTQFGDISAALDLSPEHTLPELVRNAGTDETMTLRTMLTRHAAGFTVACGAEFPADGDRVTGEQVGWLIDELKGIFSHIVVDTASGLGEHRLAALERATQTVTLCTLSVSSLRALRKELDVLSQIGLARAHGHVVLNLADRTSGLFLRDAEVIAGVPMDVVVPRSPAAVQSTNRGVPLLLDRPRDAAARALQQLVVRVGAERVDRLIPSNPQKAES